MPNPNSSTYVTRTTIGLAAAALIGGGALAVNAHGQGQAARTITFTGGQPARHDVKQIDLKPRGESLGDQMIAAVTIRLDGKPRGRLLSQCTATDASFQGQSCTLTLLTRDGQIIAQGAGEHRPLPGQGGAPDTGDIFAITGATGSYQGATGTVRPRATKHGETITVTLDGRA